MFTPKTPKEVEKNLEKLFADYTLTNKLSVKTIKDWIYNDEGDSAMEASHLFQKKWFKYFPNINDLDEINHVLHTFTDAWNYFPHKSLSGKSPYQKVKEAYKEPPQNETPSKKEMPNVVVGGIEMNWKEYEQMLKKMEKVQAPFKKWIKKDLLPEYEHYLRKSYTDKTVAKHFGVANIFFDRVLHVGFVHLDLVRKAFIQKEFPKWWQTHVMMSNLSEKEVLSSLKRLFEFISQTYDIDIKKFGF